jgi:hypothetical protein
MNTSSEAELKRSVGTLSPALASVVNGELASFDDPIYPTPADGPITVVECGVEGIIG